MTEECIAEVNQLIELNPEWGRSKLSQKLCEMWGWRGENGQLKDISCRDVLRALDAAGKIKLPERQTDGRSKGGKQKWQHEAEMKGLQKGKKEGIKQGAVKLAELIKAGLSVDDALKEVSNGNA